MLALISVMTLNCRIHSCNDDDDDIFVFICCFRCVKQVVAFGGGHFRLFVVAIFQHANESDRSYVPQGHEDGEFVVTNVDFETFCKGSAITSFGLLDL